MFTDAQKDALLRTAREAIRAQVTGVAIACAPCAPLPTGTGAFVTIRRDGQLRGCLGTLECRLPLLEEVARCAARAAREDPRFAPVDASELQALTIEVSILGPLEPISPHDDEAIVIGRHGLVVERGSRRGLLRPLGGVVGGWGPGDPRANRFLKGGRPRAGCHHGAIVYRFEAVVFGD
jgi:AmmeMemoRadiSam system protein A